LALKELPRKKTLLVVLAVFCVALPFAFYRPSGVRLRVGSSSYTLALATTEQTRNIGLGGRNTMALDQGMLFVFDKPAVQCFWMKDMHFPLDIIWLDAAKGVSYIKQNVSPDTYPATFCSPTATKYVIELNAGEVAKQHMSIGQKLSL